MYLSKLLLNPRSQQARRDAASAYEFHRTLARAFPTPDGINYRSESQVLFRSELRLRNGKTSLTPTLEMLVQSQREPAWDQLPANYLMHSASTKVFDLSVTTGQEYAFCLVANPTRKVKRPGQTQGKRVALPDFTTEEGVTPARAWLARQGEQHGFDVLFLLTEASWLNEPAAKTNYNKSRLPIYRVRYEGLLRVTDPEKLVAAVVNGIGPAKAFGCGLLSLAKP